MSNDTSTSPLSLITSPYSDRALSHVPPELHVETRDAELDIISNGLYGARRMRNKKIGACKLPCEIIAYIFECLQPLWPPQRLYIGLPVQSRLKFAAGWISVSHVCSIWREVALGFPSLWTKPRIDVFGLPSQYIPDILFRSRSAPLDLAIDWDGDYEMVRQDPNLKAWLSPSIFRRAKRLEIVAEELPLVERIATQLCPTSEMAYLRELHITLSQTDNPVVLPASFRDFPSLTRLTLNNFEVPWASPLLSSQLVELHLSCNRVGPRPSYDELSVMLTSLQTIKVLELQNIIPLLSPIRPFRAHDAPITMSSHLRSLTTCCIEDGQTGMDGLMFVSSLRVPARCAHKHTFAPPQGEESDISAIMGRLLPDLSLASGGKIELRHLYLDCDKLYLVLDNQRQSTSSPEHPSRLSDEGVTNALYVPMYDEDEEVQCFHLVDYLQHITLKHLDTISFDMTSVRLISQGNLWPHLLRANNVRQVALLEMYEGEFNVDFSHILPALSSPQPTGTGDETRMLFPSLEVLALPISSKKSTHQELVIDLIDLIHARREQEVPLHELLVPKAVGGWAVWDTLRTMLKVTLIDFPVGRSPVMPEDSHV
ncbi:unnamed protein product [Peniophora sp. CBMAI 1063]|nr:unnamed protein product [Peniophora sp. CBMAI 1063]